MSVPSNVTVPASDETMRATIRAVVLLPDPDSPTSENVDPRGTENSTASTARTAWVPLP